MNTKGALANIRVIDLSRVLAGPFCTQILGDLGAEIIKIEKPNAGDDTRYWGPPFLKDASGKDTTESAYYLSANRSKKSIAIDIKSKDGQDLIHKLLESADILIENFIPGGLEKYGLGYNQIKDKHPHIIYCSISGFGQTGPMSGEPGYDFLAQGMAGLMATSGYEGQPPIKTGIAVSDLMTGLNAAIGILAALHHRQTSGKGQMVDVALIDCTLAAMTNVAQYYLTSGKLAPRVGNAHSTIVPYEIFEAQDGHVIIAVGNDGQFRKLCEFIDRKDFIDDPRFSTNRARVLNREILIPQIKEITKQKPVKYWLEGFLQIDVPAGPVNTMNQVFEMPQVQAREMEIEMKHALSDAPVKLVGSPIKLSETPAQYYLPPPYLGQHTQEILENVLKLSADEIRNLKNKKIIS